MLGIHYYVGIHILMSNCMAIGTQGLIFVIDSSDRARMDEARQELHRIINDREMKDSQLLVFANKQDLKEGLLHSPLRTYAGETDYADMIVPQP